METDWRDTRVCTDARCPRSDETHLAHGHYIDTQAGTVVADLQQKAARVRFLAGGPIP